MDETGSSARDPIWKRISQISAGMGGVCMAVTLVIGSMLSHRMGFDYDDHGLHQDPQSLYVYSKGTLLPLWIIFAAAGGFFGLFFWIGRRVLRFEV
jgi:hypothetical protein